MALLLALLAVLLAAAACLVALRTQRHVERLAAALAREWGLRGAAGAGPDEVAAGRPVSPASEQEAWLRRSVEALEQRLREVLARAAQVEAAASARPEAAAPAPSTGPGEAAAPPDARETVRLHLVRLGYDEVALWPAGAPGGFTFEAREQGMPRKGSARVDEEGRVRVRHAGAQRVFP